MAATTLSLYRQLLRASNGFDSYNFRKYALRKVKGSFKEHAKESNPEKISTLIQEAETNLAMIKRQATISHMFKSDPLVIE